MPTDTSAKNDRGKTPTTSIGSTEVFAVLANKRRRYTLHYLSQSVGAVSLGDLAEQIALWEKDPTDDQYQRILTDLYHTHLPKLADCGLITYDLKREEVNLLETVDAVKPYLDLAAEDDFS